MRRQEPPIDIPSLEAGDEGFGNIASTNAA
jgi:hypothetical protein